jgi:hypothetical protein
MVLKRVSPRGAGREAGANGVFIIKAAPTYGDLPEVRYHFPRQVRFSQGLTVLQLRGGERCRLTGC